MRLCLQIEVKAVPIDKDLGDNANRQRRSSGPGTPLDVPYEITVKDKTCYHSISVMKVSLHDKTVRI